MRVLGSPTDQHMNSLRICLSAKRYSKSAIPSPTRNLISTKYLLEIHFRVTNYLCQASTDDCQSIYCIANASGEQLPLDGKIK